MLVLRAMLAFLALPGLVAFAAPLLLIWPRPLHTAFSGSGFAVLAIGVVLLLWCVRDFYVAGRGTLAPWDPPRHLVVTGLYRFSRNPMYVAVFMVLLGWAIGFRSPLLGAYALAVLVAFHLRVVFGEEPWLAQTHGEAWTRYAQDVPRWLGVSRRGAHSKSDAVEF
jgi:protein-S-isoprenylcysteine O-methyltransferase Ste14